MNRRLRREHRVWADETLYVIVSVSPKERAMQLDQQEKEFESWDLRSAAEKRTLSPEADRPQNRARGMSHQLLLPIGSSAFCLSGRLNASHHDPAQGRQTKYVFLHGDLQSRPATMPYLRTQQHR